MSLPIIDKISGALGGPAAAAAAADAAVEAGLDKAEERVPILTAFLRGDEITISLKLGVARKG